MDGKVLCSSCRTYSEQQILKISVQLAKSFSKYLFSTTKITRLWQRNLYNELMTTEIVKIKLCAFAIYSLCYPKVFGVLPPMSLRLSKDWMYHCSEYIICILCCLIVFQWRSMYWRCVSHLSLTNTVQAIFNLSFTEGGSRNADLKVGKESKHDTWVTRALKKTWMKITCML